MGSEIQTDIPGLLAGRSQADLDLHADDRVGRQAVYACEFIRQNKLRGNMFNYWTEGGFIAWGQDPDPETGKTPLQLFMDGRAQAAYDTKIFDLWTLIMSGGQAARRAAIAGRSPTNAELVEIGNWVTEQLERYGVWVVLMPNNQFDKPFVNGLEACGNWAVVFRNNKQKLFVSIKSEKGRALYDGMFSGQTKYPDEFARMLSVGRNLLLFRDPEKRKDGVMQVMKAFDLNPSPAPMLDLLLLGGQHADLRPLIDEFCISTSTISSRTRPGTNVQTGRIYVWQRPLWP